VNRHILPNPYLCKVLDHKVGCLQKAQRTLDELDVWVQLTVPPDVVVALQEQVHLLNEVVLSQQGQQCTDLLGTAKRWNADRVVVVSIGSSGSSTATLATSRGNLYLHTRIQQKKNTVISLFCLDCLFELHNWKIEVAQQNKMKMV